MSNEIRSSEELDFIPIPMDEAARKALAAWAEYEKYQTELRTRINDAFRKMMNED